MAYYQKTKLKEKGMKDPLPHLLSKKADRHEMKDITRS